MAALLVTTLPSCHASNEHAEVAATFDELDHWRDVVYNVNACALPGVDIKYDSFLDCMWAATRAGFVQETHAQFVAEGLRWGFKFGVDVAALKGQRIFKNYESTEGARDAVTRSLMKRVAAGKTLCLGTWSSAVLALLRERFDDFFIFPMGAVEKALEPGEYRPTSDHTRTGLNAATVLGPLRHALTAYKDVAAFLQRGYFMYVSDVEAAFPMLPIHPRLWAFFMCRFYAHSDHESMSLFVHLTGDFGAAGLPGTFKIFLVDVVVQMARYVNVLKLPMPVYVDDMAMIAPSASWANDEMSMFQAWASEVCGVAFKWLKDRRAAVRQLYLGFWWDSISLTRTLEEHKLVSYLALLDEYAKAASLTLRERRVVAGKMQRAVLTLPAGAACLLASIFALVAGLVLPWHKRRTTKEERADYALLASLLRLNMGRGFYRNDDFQKGRACALSDASKSPDYTGGGYVTRGVRNCYHFFKYGGRAARKSIMVHEGDTALKCGSDMGYLWRGLVVDFGVDNTSFKGSVAKGYSKSWELTVLCKRWFVIQVRHCFLVNWFWLSSEDNVLADHLSRGREDEFLKEVVRTGFWSAAVTEDPYFSRHPEAGSVRTYENFENMAILKSDEVSAWTPQCEGDYGPKVVDPSTLPTLEKDSPSEGMSRCTRGGFVRTSTMGLKGWLHLLCLALLCAHGDSAPSGGAASAVSAQQMSVPYSRSMIFDGLPLEWVSRLEDILDMRLAPSSMRTVNSAVSHWRPVAEKYSWPVVLKTDDPQRAAKMATFVLSMMDDTSLVYKSISAYVWGLRQFMILHHQADPINGVANWKEFMSSVQVMTHVPGEPRRALPMEVIQRILEDTDEASFEDVCFSFFIVLLLFTFSRSECPCPKTFEGFDPEEHWQVCDIRWRCVDGAWCLAVRFKKVKQDPRLTRPAVNSGDGDWAYVGDSPEPFSVLKWFKAYMEFFPQGRAPEDPFFLARDRSRPYTYSAAMSDLRRRCARVGVDGALYGIHGLRVEGYNASLHANGENRTVVHGLWSGPQSAGRYLRLNVPDDIVPMASNMVRLHQERQRGVPSEHESEESLGHPQSDVESASEQQIAERVFRPRSRVSPAPSRRRASSQGAASSGSASNSRRRARSRATPSPRPAPSAEPEAVLPARGVSSDASILSLPRRASRPPQTYRP